MTTFFALLLAMPVSLLWCRYPLSSLFFLWVKRDFSLLRLNQERNLLSDTDVGFIAPIGEFKLTLLLLSVKWVGILKGNSRSDIDKESILATLDALKEADIQMLQLSKGDLIPVVKQTSIDVFRMMNAYLIFRHRVINCNNLFLDMETINWFFIMNTEYSVISKIQEILRDKVSG